MSAIHLRFESAKTAMEAPASVEPVSPAFAPYPITYAVTRISGIILVIIGLIVIIG